MELNTDFMIKTLHLALRGIPVTLQITVVTLLVSIPLAFLMALSKIYDVRVIRKITTVFVSFVRGTPVVLQILIVYSLLPSLVNAIALKAGWRFNVFDVNPVWYAFVVFSLNTSAVLSEVFRSAILTVDKGQLEAALSAGLSTPQAYRRIVMPQALLVALPNICNATINLIKGTSLAFMMTVKDVTAIAKVEAAYGYNYIEAYLDIFLIYIVICGIAQVLFTIVEKRLGIYRAANVAF